MKDNFELALSEVLKSEGGYVNHPQDPGGATNRGITQAVYDGWRTQHSIPRASVRYILDSEVKAIYRARYWNAVKGDDLPSGVDYCIFDFAVNSSPTRAAKYLQTAVGAAPDGFVGKDTIAMAADASPTSVINAVCDSRLTFLRGLRTWATFGKGWERRVAAVRKLALALVKVPEVKPVTVSVPADTPAQAGWWRRLVDWITRH